MLLIDAMRWDYVSRTRFLRSCAAEGISGRIEEPFGFTPRAAYFRGVDIEADGFTHMFEWDPAGSPFSVAAHLAELARQRPECEPTLRAQVVATARDRLSAFAGAYVSTGAIPFAALPFFGVAEREAPWSSQAPADSLFSKLRDANRSFGAYAWPDTNGQSDRATVAQALAGINPATRFAFVHLSALDATGHSYGPGARETQRALEDTDRLVESLVAHCRRVWGSVRLIAFGDHGMVRVVRAVDAIATLTQSGLRFGRDVGYFVDSTGIRFWYFTSEARETVRHLFDGVDYGRFLGQDDWARFGLERCSRRNGDDYFLAHPGIVLAPNFFGVHPPNGMHGYEPSCLDNQGALVYWDSAAPEPARSAGVVPARRLYATMLRAAALAVPADAPPPVVAAECAPVMASYTVAGSSAHEAQVARDLGDVVRSVRETVPDCEAIALLGSFGRGEGVVRDEPRLSAINDYDIFVIGGTRGTGWNTLRTSLRARCAVDDVDLGFAPAGFVMHASQTAYDARRGARVLYGAPDSLDHWGSAAPADLGPEAAWLGIANRICGLLDAVASSTPDPRRVYGQLVKLGVALGDAYLMFWQDYHDRGTTRLDRFTTLATAAGIHEDVRRAISTTYCRKLEADTPAPGWCAGHDLVALQHAVATIASAAVDGDTWTTWSRIATWAARGWDQQTSETAGTGWRSTLSDDARRALQRIFCEAGIRFLELPGLPPSEEWSNATRALAAEWLEIIH